MTSLYETLKASKLGGTAPDMFTALLAKNIAAEEVEKTISGIPPLTFRSSGKPLTSWQIDGNTVQASAPTPSAPVSVNGVGTLEGTGQHSGKYAVPVTCGGTTTSLYIGEVQSTRYVTKLVLTGEEDISLQSINSYGVANFYIYISAARRYAICTHLQQQTSNIGSTQDEGFLLASASGNRITFYIRIFATTAATKEEMQAYLANQYAAGTPVTIWYVLAEPETAIVNEPLHKIGNYADTVTEAQAGTDIPTVRGTNTLTVGTTVQPSSMTITYKEG